MQFEGTHVSYMFRQAKMVFFKASAYPAYAIVDGKYVEDKSEQTTKFQGDAVELQKLVEEVASRVGRGMKVPATWRKKLRIEGLAMALALDGTGSTYKEWAEQFYRSLRFLDTYQT